MPTLLGARRLLIQPSYDLRRRLFVAGIRGVLGTAPVAFWMPRPTDLLTSRDEGTGNRTWTAEATMLNRLTRLGYGYALSFNGTSNYLNTPDTADLTFVEPAVFSMLAVANVTDTAAIRIMIGKGDSTQSEYDLRFTAADLFQTTLLELDAVDFSVRRTSAAATQGSWQVFGSSYNGLGGATAADGVTLYQGGAASAVTSVNDAQYTAMADGTGLLSIGAINTGGTPANFFSGQMALALIVGADLTAAQHAALSSLARAYFKF